MIYIYNCYGGTHSSSIASAVHLNKLQSDKKPTKKQILEIDHFNKLTNKDMGCLIYMGTDENGNKVFTVGRGTSKVLIKCLYEFANIIVKQYGFKEKIVFSNMSPTVPLAMTIGGLFSRGFKINFIGVPLLVIGAKQAFYNIVELVDYTKKIAHASSENIIVLENTNIILKGG